ncbi:methyltransferase domain-containing protein [Larkinella rosea]|uniref:Methyltransferase domain-containing protein n=1 Tax=Larkinella rosea TaxID=2025312 RepID=A0A3P1C2J0_9BACT|nr:methyltransferase domain-containing protein [Larkinella rosea]RRB07316.1 methyltransferase domain-containing protein [Larkinella rosea]
MKHLISFILRTVPRPVLQRVSHYAMKVMMVFYQGNNVECTVCSKHFREFMPYGRNIPRPNALCPNCLALERHRLMNLYLLRKTNFYRDRLKVLHVAPEHCFIDRFEKLPNLDYITADIESPLAKIKMDIHQIPFPENTFDVAFCNHVMEHVDDDAKASSELYRVLKPGGWAIIQSPIDYSRATTFEDASITDPKERERLFWQSDHVRLFGRDYAERLAKGGFTVIEDRFVFELPREEVKRFSLPAGEIIYLCKK